jgi:hypothetical protein
LAAGAARIAVAAALAACFGPSAYAAGYNVITIPMTAAPASDYQYAASINASGQVLLVDQQIGISQVYNLNTLAYGSVPSDPLSLPNRSFAGEMNNAGAIVGYYQPSAGGDWQSYVLQSGAFTPVGVTTSSYNLASGISNNGKIAGVYQDTTGNFHGYVGSGGLTTTIDVPASWGSQTEAVAINDSGVAVGIYNTAANPSLNEGFIDDAGVFTPVTVPGYANAEPGGINDEGVLVGVAFGAALFDQTGFIDRGGVITTFSVPGAAATQLAGVNDFGDLTGGWLDSAGDWHPFVAMPTSVPEAPTWTMMALGFVGLGLAGRRAARKGFASRA